MTTRPPKLALRVLEKVLAGDPAAPAILGDLQEDFARQCRSRGRSTARLWYWREALLLAAGRVFRRSARRGVSDAGGAYRELGWDVRYALRAIARTPGFSLFTAAVIGLGVGASTSVYSVLRPLMLSPLPLERAHELVWIQNESESGDNSLSAITSRTANLYDFRRRARSFDGLTGYNAFFDQVAYTLTGRGEPERLVGAGVAHDFLDVLGVDVELGRRFTAEEGVQGGPRAVILSHGFWVRRFGGDPIVVGSTLTLNGSPHEVVGVLPRSFDFSAVFTPGARVDFLLPFAVLSAEDGDFQGNVLFMIGRLRPGVTVDAAQAELDAIMSALEQEQPRRWGLGARVSSLQDHVAGPFRPALLLLAAAAGTLLLIVCVNVSNLVLSRAPGRAREVAVRKAFGAPRWRLVRQLLLETIGISLAGALLGGALASAATRIISGAAGLRIPLLTAVELDTTAILFASAVAVLTGVLVGALPALQVAEGGEAAALRSGSRGSSASRGARRLRELLVFAEVTLACVLVVVGGLLVRSFQSVLAVDLGFEPANAVAWQLNAGTRFEEINERAAFYTQVADQVAALPGIEQAGLIDGVPLGRNRTWGFSVPGQPEEQTPNRQLFPHVIDPGYLAAMGVALVSGRNLSREDGWETPRVVLINESGATRAFGGDDPIGRRIEIWSGEWEVVGVVEDVRDIAPELEPGVQIYFPISQMPDYESLDLVVRSRLPTEQVVEAVSRRLRELDPAMPTGEYWTLDSTVERAVSARRFTLGVLGAFGVAALVLAGLGIYGVLAQAVAERRPEIGIRIALGASSVGIVSNVLGRTLLLSGAGVLTGALVAITGARLIGSLLFGVEAADPVTFVGTAATLLGVAVLAAAVPAARALRTPSARALMAE